MFHVKHRHASTAAVWEGNVEVQRVGVGIDVVQWRHPPPRGVQGGASVMSRVMRLLAGGRRRDSAKLRRRGQSIG